MTSFAMYVDQSLQAKGVDPATKSQEYYKEVDTAMKNQFPNFFGVQPQNETEVSQGYTAPKRQPSTVVASATRDSGNKKPTQIRMNQTQVKIARQLGISPEQYANQLLKES
jgi:endo-alpha-1,4-polygalactosaminidase (GH114 family)